MGRSESFSAIMDQFRALITSGTWEPGLQLPTEQELARRHQRCRGTIRKILVRLQADGLIRSEAGKGHFVRGGRASPVGSPDLSLVMGLDCANWESEIAGVRLHELLAERVAQEGGRLRHIQFPVDDDGQQALQDLAADPATNVVIVAKPWPTRFAELHFFGVFRRIRGSNARLTAA
jgi:DNA-binding FadR family transcriptional regulator